MHSSNPVTGRSRPREPFPYLAHLGLNPLKMIVYLYHLDPPYKHAAHYMGSTDDLDRRDSEHGGPHGARLLQVQKEAGGTWHLVRTWAGGKQKESELKSNNGSRYCPECTEYPLPGINTQPRQRKTRCQRAQEQQRRDTTHAGHQPEPVPFWLWMWQIERTAIPVPVPEQLTDDALAAELSALDAVEAQWPRQALAGLYGIRAAGGHR